MDIHIREKCADCRGNGMVQHPAWKQYWKSIDYCFQEGFMSEIPDEAFRSRWFTEHGYPATCDRDLPSEEIPCPSCKGIRYTEKWVPIKQVLEMLLAKE